MASFAPYLYDWIWTLVVLGVLAAAVVAIVQINRMDGLRASTQLLLTAVVVLLPVIGPAAWFVARARTRSTA